MEKKKESYGWSYRCEGAPVIGTATDRVKEKDGLIFRNLSGEDELLPYEDWRLSADERAKDLASRLPVETIAGLMMYSPHQAVPSMPGPFGADTYGGKIFPESGAEPWELSDSQKVFLGRDGVRHVLVTNLESVETAVKWQNAVQKFAEEQPFGIPVNFSSDPRHGAGSEAEFKTAGSINSKWPEGLGLAATFSPELVERFAQVVSEEYRALGIATALFPQVDLGTEPRWLRVEDTFGPHPQMTTDMGRAYCDGLQTTEGSDTGWGEKSVNAMVKHWPGGGPCEGGRDAHYPFGKFAVYPGKNINDHLRPFTEGAFALKGKTGCASAVMPYYTVSYDANKLLGGENDEPQRGNSYNHFLINDLLREKYGYDGVVCTDWGITQDPAPIIDSFGSRCYGVEKFSESERHLIAIENGVDQFGGNCEAAPILEAYRLGCEKYGEKVMRERFEKSAVRLLRNFFRCGLFENPYLDAESSSAVAAREDFVREGYEAQIKSLVLIKNKDRVLPVAKGKKVFIPLRRIGKRKNFFRFWDEEKTVDPAGEGLSERFERTEKCDDADFALVCIESPLSTGYTDGEGYKPVMLQYRPYTAEAAREVSVAGGDPREDFLNRSYKGKTNTAANESDLDLVIETKKKMGDKPVIVCVRMHNPCVLSELEPYADAIIIDFGVSRSAVYDIVSGAYKPSGLLPVQLPRDMETVEKHCEDIPFDIIPYTDSCGETYDFGFGLDFDGRIDDERTKKYKK